MTLNKAIRVVVTGVSGRMGGVLVKAVRHSDDLVLSGATEKAGKDTIGLDAGLVAGTGLAQVPVRATLEEAIAGADVVVDFTHADASLEHARLCAEKKVALVLGSTGFSASARAEIAGRAQQIPIVMSPNMSVGVNVLFRLAGEVAKVLGAGYDVEIVETHHRHKKDAPSGTAVRLVEVVADALKLDPERDAIHGREGNVGERPDGKIGVMALRGGDVVGEHTVMYLGDGERIELTHRATSRSNFAGGALRAARWIVHQKPGLYDMTDVLGLSRTP
jgi:4-hydroxy-tetrahydrodipicolinate reductase